jgi:hypothetical protein
MISVFMMVGVLVLFFIFQDIIMGLVELSETQASQEEDDVRARSTKFYLTEFYPNKVNYILGNGASHLANAYGLKVMYYQTVFGYYLSDIGIVGVYVKFGVLYVVGVFILMRKIFTANIEPRYLYFKYSALLLLLNEIMGGSFAKPSSFIVTIAMLYIMDVSSHKLRYSAEQVESE